jgi:8-oxo-dGTP diphosphatase
MQRYACGYLIDPDRRVVLIRKNRPAWQAGRLNGVGGHVEPGETPVEAMRREFFEETGLDVDGWQHFATVAWSTGETNFYRRFADAALLDAARTVTDEVIEVHPFDGIPWQETVPSLAWLLPLALYPTPLAEPVVVREAV